jgi:hypothetical protein
VCTCWTVAYITDTLSQLYYSSTDNNNELSLLIAIETFVLCIRTLATLLRKCLFLVYFFKDGSLKHNKMEPTCLFLSNASTKPLRKHQCVNQRTQIEEKQKTQWPKEKGNTTIYKTPHIKQKTSNINPTKTGGRLRCPRRVRIVCSTSCYSGHKPDDKSWMREGPDYDTRILDTVIPISQRNI